MSRYIDADALLSRLPDDLPYKASVKRVLTQAPTADVVEVRHGYWKTVTELKDDTVCGNKVNIQYKICSSCEYPMGVTDNIYCGHCGAKMDGERSENETTDRR